MVNGEEQEEVSVSVGEKKEALEWLEKRGISVRMRSNV